MAKRYWLFKSEPDCFSIDHLKAADNSTASWDGVRNYQARNMLRDEISVNDEVFFYYSSSDPLGISGVCSVSKGGYPDHTGWDINGQHYDPKASPDNPIWYMVDVSFVKKFPRVISLAELKGMPGLEDMVVTQRGSRLSIQPVRPEEWEIILQYAKKLK
ncbi:MAG: EVE domain-containing protein [candidate division Zixibacteria bacterium]|nr:EVE domain-containing protein [candidate division Zixibacteria bacterium]